MSSEESSGRNRVDAELQMSRIKEMHHVLDCSTEEDVKVFACLLAAESDAV